MKIIRSRKAKKKNPKRSKKVMAKRRKKSRGKKAVKITVNPKRKRRYRKNPVRFHSRRKYRRNPAGFSAKGIMEFIKPVALGALGALVINKVIAMVPLAPEKENLKPWIKLGAGVAIAYFGRKYQIAKLGGIFVATLAVRDMIAEKFPALVAGTDDFDVIDEDQLLGNQVEFMGNQVQFSGAAGVPEDQVYFDSVSDPYSFAGY